ncbi:hypothetical protein AAMO2058_000143000 [Amorphochlora amoebiformis]
MPGGKARSTERRTPGGNDDSVPLLAKKVKVLEEGTMAVKKGAKLFGMTTYRVRILALLLVAAAGLSNNWVYYSPAALFSKIQRHFGGPDKYTPAMSLLLFSVYSWPNILLPFFGGYLSDGYLGLRRSFIVACSLVLLGQLGFVLGAFRRGSGGWFGEGYIDFLTGRIIFGVGGEILMAIQNAAAIRWAAGHSPSLALASIEALCRLCAACTFLLSPMLAEATPLSIVALVGAGLCALSLIAAILFAYVDSRAESHGGILTLPTLRNPRESRDSRRNCTCRGLLRMPRTVWLLAVTSMGVCISTMTFLADYSETLRRSDGGKAGGDSGAMSEARAGAMAAIVNVVALILLPVFGILYDHVGGALNGLAASHVLLIFSHCSLAVYAAGMHPSIVASPDNPEIPGEPHWQSPGLAGVVARGMPAVMVAIGTGLAMGLAAINPLLGLSVPPSSVATGFGLLYAFENLGTALAPIIIVLIQNCFPPGSPAFASSSSWVLVACTCLSLLSVLSLFYLNTRRSKPVSQRDTRTMGYTVVEGGEEIGGSGGSHGVFDKSWRETEWSMNAPLLKMRSRSHSG